MENEIEASDCADLRTALDVLLAEDTNERDAAIAVEYALFVLYPDGGQPSEMRTHYVRFALVEIEDAIRGLGQTTTLDDVRARFVTAWAYWGTGS